MIVHLDGKKYLVRGDDVALHIDSSKSRVKRDGSYSVRPAHYRSLKPGPLTERVKARAAFLTKWRADYAARPDNKEQP